MARSARVALWAILLWVMSTPHAHAEGQRLVTVDDLSVVRAIDALGVSPDGQHYSILVRQVEPANNNYRLTWFAGAARGGELVR